MFDNLVAFLLAAPSKVAYLIHKTLTQDRFVLGPQQVSSDMCEKSKPSEPGETCESSETAQISETSEPIDNSDDNDTVSSGDNRRN